MARRVMMGIQELRLRLRERVADVQRGIHTIFTRHGVPVAVLVDVDWYQRATEAIGEDPLGFETVPPPSKDNAET
ncbi:type II toxin-antitoxin system prevent-host-death family antitoxin [Micromonospora sp. FIMYZ51]|uniref:type II toxin-antitoxin system prevent-host-death family antitoxin n=1 Tax=Micromonospora sp. FIMYZ51 TaxID=3051832 RepID=UPI00311EF605